MTKIAWEAYNKTFEEPIIPPVPTDYVSYYMFNGNGNDESGTYDATINSATLTTDRFSNSNRAYTIAGTTQSITSSLPFSNTSFTISWWTRINAIPSSNSWAKVGSGWGGFLCHCEGTNLGVYCGTDAGTRFSPTDAPTIFVLDTWVNATYTYDNVSNTATFYKNGSYVNSKTQTDPVGSGTLALNNASASCSFSITDVRKYNRVLTTDEISLIYNEPNPI